MIELQSPDTGKVTRSAMISLGGVFIALLFLITLKVVFPEYDASQLQSMLFTAAGAWIFNVIRESIK
jgi:hypothetical protein